MDSEMLKISHRIPQSKAKQLRRQGYVPGVLYGNEQITTPVIFDKKRVEYFIHHVGDNAMFEISLEGEIRPVRIREIQRDPVTREIIHMDLQNVQMDRIMKVTIPLRFEGVHEVEKRGFILQHQKDTVEVEGIARNIPSHIKVPVHLLTQRQSIKVFDLEIAAELSIVDDAQDVVAMVVNPTRQIVDEDQVEQSDLFEKNESKKTEE